MYLNCNITWIYLVCGCPVGATANVFSALWKPYKDPTLFVEPGLLCGFAKVG